MKSKQKTITKKPCNPLRKQMLLNKRPLLPIIDNRLPMFAHRKEGTMQMNKFISGANKPHSYIQTKISKLSKTGTMNTKEHQKIPIRNIGPVITKKTNTITSYH